MYTKTIRSIWLDNRAHTYLPVEQLDLTHAATPQGRQVTEYLDWIRENADFSVDLDDPREYTRVYLTENQYVFVQLKWPEIRFATHGWKLQK